MQKACLWSLTHPMTMSELGFPPVEDSPSPTHPSGIYIYTHAHSFIHSLQINLSLYMLLYPSTLTPVQPVSCSLVSGQRSDPLTADLRPGLTTRRSCCEPLTEGKCILWLYRIEQSFGFNIIPELNSLHFHSC